MNKIKQKFLISRIRKGDSEAFREIYQIFSNRIYRFIFFRLPNESDAQDLLQETFLNLWDYLNNKEKEVKNLQALLYQIAKNLVANYYKNNDAKLSNEVSIEEIEYKVGESENLNQKIDIRISIKNIHQKLNKLNPEHREIIKLRFLDDLSHKQIAQILNKTENNVRVLFHRALKELRIILKQEEEKND